MKLIRISNQAVIENFDPKLYKKNKKQINAEGYYSEKEAERILSKEVEVVLIKNSKGTVSTCSIDLYNKEIEYNGQKMKHSDKLALLGYSVVEPEVEEATESTPPEINNEDNSDSTATVSGEGVQS